MLVQVQFQFNQCQVLCSRLECFVVKNAWANKLNLQKKEKIPLNNEKESKEQKLNTNSEKYLLIFRSNYYVLFLNYRVYN